MGETRKLAEFSSALNYDDLKPEIANNVALHLLDSIGCNVYSATLPHCQKVINVVDSFGARPEASVLGTSIRTSADNAALANGTMIQGYECDDIGVYCHPGSCVVPAAVAISERLGGVDGKTLLAGVLAGYEATIRAAESTGLHPESHIGWHTPGFHGTIGAAVCAARIMGLDEERMFHAIGISADIAGGGLFSARPTAAEVKRMHAGRAAQSGIQSALLAAEGFTGVADVLEFEPWGYCWAVSGYGAEGPKPWNLNAFTDGLGDTFISMERVAFKYFPTIAFNNSVQDNAQQIRKENDFEINDIAKVELKMARMHVWGAKMYRPVDDITGANFSSRYSAALGLMFNPAPLYESPDVLTLWRTKYKDARVQELLAKMVEVVDEELDAKNPYCMDTTVVVHLKDGRTLSRTTGYSADVPTIGAVRLGFADQDNNDDASKVKRKFLNMVGQVLPAGRAADTLDAMESIASCEDVSAVFKKFQVA